MADVIKTFNSEEENNDFTDEELFLFVRYHLISKVQIVDTYKLFLKTHERVL